MKFMVLGCTLMFLVGCSPSAKETGKDVTDVITQENKLQSAQQAGGKLKAIGVQRNDEMREAVGE